MTGHPVPSPGAVGATAAQPVKASGASGAGRLGPPRCLLVIVFVIVVAAAVVAVSDGIDSGLVNAGGLATAGWWTRSDAGANGGSWLFVTQFRSPTRAVDFNAGISREYADGPVVRSGAIPGVPSSIVYLYAASASPSTSARAGATPTPTSPTTLPPSGGAEATAWFTVGTYAVGVCVVDGNDDPVAVADALAQAQYRLLTA
jgi:hypothetical protein